MRGKAEMKIVGLRKVNGKGGEKGSPRTTRTMTIMDAKNMDWMSTLRKAICMDQRGEELLNMAAPKPPRAMLRGRRANLRFE